MMSLLAMAPPLSIGGKLVAAILMLALTAALVRTIRGALNYRSMVVASVICVAAVVVLDLTLTDDRGVLAAIVGALVGVIFLRPELQQPAAGRPSRTLPLVALALASGPLIGLLLATLSIVFGDVDPPDRAHRLAVSALIGTVSGIIGACVVGAVAAVSSPSDIGRAIRRLLKGEPRLKKPPQTPG